MKKRHTFNFDGGDYLTTIGATWFVSYSFYSLLDKTHKNWQNVETYKSRINTFNKTKNYHEFWLRQVLNMNDDNLNTDKLNLNAVQTKQMAKSLLKICQDNSNLTGGSK